MSRKIYIGEDNLINLKNAMAGKNIGHSTFMQEDKPPYEKDEFTINPEGGANDNFHVNESYRFSKKIGSKKILTESQESKSIAAAKKLVMQRLGYNEQEADEFVRVKLRNDIPSLRTPQGGKFILGVTRMFCDGELRSANDIGNLNSTLKLVASNAHINEYDRNLNNLSCQELIQRFAKAMSDNLDAEKAEINQMVFDTPSDYEIVRIDSFEQAEEYGDYVSWCVTHNEDMFDSYTSDGINQFYFCLKNGFRSVDKQPGNGCPLDEYGLSMIAVSVNENGMLNTCTCRWNHDNGGDDSIMNAKEVSQVICANFFDVFKPNNKWNELLANIKQRLANGEEPIDVFDDVGDFSEGFAFVEFNGKYNFVNQEGELLSDKWFDDANDFSEGFAWVKLNGKYNFINQEGRFLSDQWFDDANDFSEGFATIMLNGKYNFINQEGRIICDQWFDYACRFSEGFAWVKLNEKFNFINKEGRIICDQWFDSAYYFNEGFAWVKLNGKYNFVNQEGELLSDKWFDDANEFSEGFAFVEFNGKYNFINKEGKFLSNQWFDDASGFSEGFARVKLNGKYNFINQEGRIICDQWFDEVYFFFNGFAWVKLNGKYNFVNQEGELLCDQWFDYACSFGEGFAWVKLNGKDYKLDANGNLTLAESKKNKTIVIPENKLIAINEHHLDQRLPFDEKEFSRKRYIEQYVDWLEEFGRYGELPDGTLDFWEEIAKAVKVIREKSLHGRFDGSLPLGKTDEEIVEELKNEKIGPYLKLDGEKIYVERAIKIDKSPRAYYNGKKPKDDELYTKLIRAYNDNVGGCWSYKKGGAQAYCSSSGAEYKILLCGFIRTDDIDFIKTVQLNYHYPSEHEIRVNPFAKIELEGIGYNSSDYIPFGRHLIVSATYSGNNSKSNILGFTKVDDGFGGIKYIDRRTRQETTKDELSKEIMNRISNGEITLDLFDYAEDVSNGFVKVSLNGKWNLINQEGRTISDQWFDFIGEFNEGIAVVGLNGKRNIINQEGRIISDQWFDSAINFNNGFVKVELSGKYNLINKEGRIISDQWFDYIGEFNEGFANVLLNRRHNFINQEGRIISDQWFDNVQNFYNGFANVLLNRKHNFINQEGRTISDQWFDYVNNFVNGFAKVLLNRKYNLINKEGRIISDQWFDKTYDFADGFAKVELSGKRNFINKEGRLISNQWFDSARDFVNGFAVVLLNEKYNLINQEGRTISDQWFDYAYNLVNGFAVVILNEKYNFINKEGRLISNQWFDYAFDFDNGFAKVTLNGKYNFINQEGSFISGQWFGDAYNFDNGFAKVELNGKYYKLDTNGNLTTLSESKKCKKIIMPENKLIAIKENLENEVEANEVSLDSFKKQKELAPKIWNGDKLNSRVRLKLLDIADDFWETTDIGWVRPKGIVLMGSICNYNWSKSSDIDLHLQVDFSEVDEKKDFVQEYFNGKKNEWNEEHSNLKIFGFPVELYVEDIDADTNSGGIYDLEENDWIKKPSKDGIKQIGLDKYSIKDKSAKIMTDIDDLYGLFKKTDDDAKLRKIGEKAHNLLSKIKAMRKDGLSRGGESDKDNIVYKVLRRTGYMDILWNLSSQLYDKLNSIDESSILEIAERYIRASLLNEEVVADGNADHNPFKKRWKYERETLINYLTNYGEIMTSKENGKQYKVLFDDVLSNRIGLNYCLCIQWNPLTMEPGNVIYVRALDKFTRRIFKPEFDTRGFDNIAGTYDDVV